MWARSNDDTRQGLGRIASLDLIGNSAVTIRDYGTTVHKRKLVLELTQGGFPTNHPLRWLAIYGYLRVVVCARGGWCWLSAVGSNTYIPTYYLIAYLLLIIVCRYSTTTRTNM